MKKLSVLILGCLLIVSADRAFSAPSSAAFTSGGGWIPGVAFGKATFSVVGRLQQDGTVTGNVAYDDHDINLSLTSTSITSFVPGCVSQIEGDGNSNFGPV